MWWTSLGRRRGEVRLSFANFSHFSALFLLRRLSQYRHALAAKRRTSSSRRKVP
jgi:hypothetical protein